MKATEICDKAKSIVGGERYGTPERNFELISAMWTIYENGVRNDEDHPSEVMPRDVIVKMILLKIARIASGHGGVDNWVDICGYAALGGELETEHKGASTDYYEDLFEVKRCSCMDCEHKEQSVLIEPCRSCMFASNWTPKEKK